MERDPRLEGPQMAELVRQARDGDAGSFCALYKSVYLDLYRFAFYTMKHQQDAEDAVSEAVIKAFEKIATLKKEESFKTWMFQIVINCCRRKLRQNRQGLTEGTKNSKPQNQTSGRENGRWKKASQGAAILRQRSRWKKTAAAAILLLAIGGTAAFGYFHENQGIGQESLRTAQVSETDQGQGGDTPDSYGQIYDLLHQLTAEERLYSDAALMDKDIAVLEDAVSGVAKAQNSAESADQDSAGSREAATGDYSATNVQTQQVDEGDLVKTDGSFIYTLDQDYNTITIVRAKGGLWKKPRSFPWKITSCPRNFM